MYDISSIKRENQEVSGRFTQQPCKATSRKCTKKRAACNQTHCCISQFWLPSPLNITRFYIQYEQTINIIYVLAPLRMHFQRSYLLWTALKVFLMHLGRNHRWRPLGFEKNNNHNQKKYRAHNFIPYHSFHSAAQPRLDFAFLRGGKLSSSLATLDNILSVFWK